MLKIIKEITLCLAHPDCEYFSYVENTDHFQLFTSCDAATYTNEMTPESTWSRYGTRHRVSIYRRVAGAHCNAYPGAPNGRFDSNGDQQCCCSAGDRCSACQYARDYVAAFNDVAEPGFNAEALFKEERAKAAWCDLLSFP